MHPRAYLYFKRNSDISRTLVANHFKPKTKTGIEKRSADVIKTHMIVKRNENRINRLLKELEEMKKVSKPIYKTHKRDLDRIVAFDKAGGAPLRVKAMLDKLPASMLPKDHLDLIEVITTATDAVSNKI